MAQDKKSRLQWNDQEDLEFYARQLRDLSAHAQSYDPPGSDSEVPSFPSWFRSFASGSESALARGIYLRLGRAAKIARCAPTILLALHDPAAVLCDGKTSLSEEEAERIKSDPSFRVREQLDVGRRLAVYPCTPIADEARRWRDEALGRQASEQMGRALRIFTSGIRKGGRAYIDPTEKISKVMTLNGRRPVEILAEMADAKRRARGADAIRWAEIDAEAVELVTVSVIAWNEAGPHRPPRGQRAPRMNTDKIRVVA